MKKINRKKINHNAFPTQDKQSNASPTKRPAKPAKPTEQKKK